MEKFTDKEALDYHSQGKPGKSYYCLNTGGGRCRKCQKLTGQQIWDNAEQYYKETFKKD